MIRTNAAAAGLLLMLIMLLSVSGSARRRETGFLDRMMRVDLHSHRYQVFVPSGWTTRKKWPVILFLHGAGERGEDGLIQTEVGLGRAIRRASDRFPCIVVFPQCPRNRWWTEPEMQRIALKALESAIVEFNGDRRRLYLTGLSMGGYGTWSIAAANPGKFAALAPVCGGIRPPAGIRVPEAQTATDDLYRQTAKKVKTTPVWVFHGAADPVVPASESRKMVEALKSVDGDVKYTEYEAVGHNSWDRAYAERDLMTWLLSHRLNPVK